MKRTLTAIILVIMMAVFLSACDSGDVMSLVSETVSAKTAAKERPEIPLTMGEATVDVGDFTVTVPEGWMGAGDLGMDDDNNYIMETYYYLLVKGGESVDDEYTKPTVSIYYTAEHSAQELYDMNISPEDENTPLDVTVGGKKCLAVHSLKDFSDEEIGTFVMEYDYVFIPVTDSSCLRVSMLTNMSNQGESGISASDPDVIAIMESLKAN